MTQKQVWFNTTKIFCSLPFSARLPEAPVRGCRTGVVTRSLPLGDTQGLMVHSRCLYSSLAAGEMGESEKRGAWTGSELLDISPDRIPENGNSQINFNNSNFENNLCRLCM